MKAQYIDAWTSRCIDLVTGVRNRHPQPRRDNDQKTMLRSRIGCFEGEEALRHGQSVTPRRLIVASQRGIVQIDRHVIQAEVNAMTSKVNARLAEVSA